MTEILFEPASFPWHPVARNLMRLLVVCAACCVDSIVSSTMYVCCKGASHLLQDILWACLMQQVLAWRRTKSMLLAQQHHWDALARCGAKRGHRSLLQCQA